jgi:hypothetical protein
VTHGRDEKFIQKLSWKPECKRQLGRSRRRWEDSIKMGLRKIGREDVIHLAQDKVQWHALFEYVMNLRVP